jgi:hypothetical protein
MNQRKTAALFLAILVPTSILIVAYAYYTGPGGSSIYGTVGSCYNVTIMVEYGKNYGYGINQTFHGLNFTSGTTVFDALRNVATVEYQYSSSLVLVTAINGVHNNASANLFWQYYVNGSYGPAASNIYHLGNNSLVEWRYQASQFRQSSNVFHGGD